MSHVDSAIVRNLNSFARLSAGERECLAAMQSPTRHVTGGTELVREGQTSHQAFILHSGWACCYKLLADGGRQIISFPLPGDFIGLRSVLLRTADHSFSAFTDATVSEVPAQRVLAVFHDHPRLGAAILWAASRDAAMVAEHLVNIGRRSAIERMAHLFLELGQRLQLVGLAVATGFECPLNQYALADALGLTAIHVNRILRQLRERGLISVRSHQVVIQDLQGLKNLAGYDSNYLDHSHRAS